MGCGSSSGGGNTRKQEKYDLQESINEGASCKVWKAENKSTGDLVALKIMRKNDPDLDTYDLFQVEVKILEALSDIVDGNKLAHPNILGCIESFEDNENYYLATTLCNGGDLFDRVSSATFTEKVAARLCRMMLGGIKHCHERSIVHRDIKPENFVFQDPTEESEMILIDFGCALQVEDNQPVLDVAGTPYYMAPELLQNDPRNGKMWKASDMWSIGVVLYMLVTGIPPFFANNTAGIARKIQRGKYKFPASANLSDSCKDIIRKMLTYEPADRISPEEALQHTWVTGESASEDPIKDDVLKSLMHFQSVNRIQKAVSRVVAKRLDEKAREALQTVFQSVDNNKDGALSINEITQLMQSIGKPPENVKKLLEEADENDDGEMDLGEMTEVYAQYKLVNDMKHQKMAFQLFDTDGDGFITVSEFESLIDLPKDEIDALLKEVDTNGDGKIDLDEWITALSSGKLNKLRD